jgi:hypothetical protein
MVQTASVALFSFRREQGDLKTAERIKPKRDAARPGYRMLDEDAELLARIRNGAADDFAEIVQRH